MIKLLDFILCSGIALIKLTEVLSIGIIVLGISNKGLNINLCKMILNKFMK